ncbi:N-acetylmuramoyl-L-alanine amidase [Kibdelosporangium aridum]|uniref:N-acetylmuramoyl-L-alanine amidase n=1 Tax=Kibdelosporangium aridum TaxID=2030 RepID=A0A428YUP2_KIBAR|nr:N-acetylmuramoyl-L-alanine amidase [Kibdelosporangium aridum]RSM73440.1 N-acetylmuramoyl-L-alanine amidase [Kibdelosporangium aridum]
MSVARAREINARLRAAGITVHEWAGWESRGNGQTSAYEGCIVHHTATAYGMAPAILVNGRPDLAGPLCNYAGNVDGSVTVIAAHPANHAGAGGGRSMGPLPVTTTFNRRVMGLEIVYPGNQPMTQAQYRTAAIWARIVTDVLGYGDIQRARAHAETSATGKWDPGFAPGRTIDMNAFRATAASGQLPVEDTVSWTENLTFTAPDGTVTTIQARDWVMWTNFAAWQAANGIATTNTKLDAIAGTLNDNQAALLAAIGDDPTQIDLTDAQVQMFLNGVSEKTKAAVKAALREGTDA